MIFVDYVVLFREDLKFPLHPVADKITNMDANETISGAELQGKTRLVWNRMINGLLCEPKEGRCLLLSCCG